MSETLPATPSRRGTETRQRTRHVDVRCTEAEWTAINAAAERAGLAVGAFMRHQAIGTPGPRAARQPVRQKVELARLLGQIGHAGSNLNQLARVANSGGDPDQMALSAAIADVQAAARMVMQALGRRSS